MQRANVLRRARIWAPLFLVLLLSMGCVPTRPKWGGGTSGGTASTVTTSPATTAVPTTTTPPSTTVAPATTTTTPPSTVAPATATTTPPSTVAPATATTTPPSTTVAPATTTTTTTTATTTTATTTTTVPVTSSSKPEAPAAGTLVGAWEAPPNGDWTKASIQSLYRQREADAGRTLDIGHSFYRWDLPFPSWRETWHAQSGRIPMVSWNGTSTSAILSGQYDAMIHQRAQGLRALNTPVFLRFFWEMSDWQVTKAENPQNYVAAWRHVHAIFEAEGVDNVSWIWCPTSWAFDVDARGGADIDRWYPGDDVVDWICSDGYNWYPTWTQTKWTSFDTIYNSFYAWGTAKNKPMMAGEFGVLENLPDQKAQWITEAQASLKAHYPRIKAVVYFDEHGRDDAGRDYNWRLDSSASAYTAWNTMLQDPYFNTRR